MIQRLVDVGGNALFLYEDSVKEIKGLILTLYEKGPEYLKMRDIARTEGKIIFSYLDIARRAIGEGIN